MHNILLYFICCYDLSNRGRSAVSLNDVCDNNNKHFLFNCKGRRRPSASSLTTSIQTPTTTRAPSPWRSCPSARYTATCFTFNLSWAETQPHLLSTSQSCHLSPHITSEAFALLVSKKVVLESCLMLCRYADGNLSLAKNLSCYICFSQCQLIMNKTQTSHTFTLKQR